MDVINDTSTVEIINEAHAVEITKKALTVDLINKTSTLESTSNSSEPIVEILSTQAEGTIQVKLGAPRQSLGTLDGPVLYDAVYQALMKICQ